MYFIAQEGELIIKKSKALIKERSLSQRFEERMEMEVKRKRKRKKLSGPIIAKKTMVISGMHCGHCVQSVTDSLNQIDGVSAKVDLAKGWAEVSLDRKVEGDVVTAAVEKEGFSVDSVQNQVF